jgi:hypothetical protein
VVSESGRLPPDTADKQTLIDGLRLLARTANAHSCAATAAYWAARHIASRPYGPLAAASDALGEAVLAEGLEIGGPDCSQKCCSSNRRRQIPVAATAAMSAWIALHVCANAHPARCQSLARGRGCGAQLGSACAGATRRQHPRHAARRSWLRTPKRHVLGGADIEAGKHCLGWRPACSRSQVAPTTEHRQL